MLVKIQDAHTMQKNPQMYPRVHNAALHVCHIEYVHIVDFMQEDQ